MAPTAPGHTAGVPALETVLLVPADHQGLDSYITIMVLAVLPRLDTMDTVMIMVLVRDITNFIHRDLRVMALAGLVVLLDLDMDLVLDPVLMDSNLKGLQVRVCMGLDMDLDMGILDTTGMGLMGGEAATEVCF